MLKNAWRKFRSWPKPAQVGAWLGVAVIVIFAIATDPGEPVDDVTSIASTTTTPSDTASTTASAGTTEAPPDTSAPATTVEPGCEPAPPAVVTAIEETLVSGREITRDGAIATGEYGTPQGILELSKAAMIKVGADRWAVAAEIDGPGLEASGDVGVWLGIAGSSGTIADGGGLFIAAESIAATFSIFPDGRKVPERSPANTASIDTESAKRCLSR